MGLNTSSFQQIYSFFFLYILKQVHFSCFKWQKLKLKLRNFHSPNSELGKLQQVKSFFSILGTSLELLNDAQWAKMY